jgi:hypothetical protein
MALPAANAPAAAPHNVMDLNFTTNLLLSVYAAT